MPNDKAVVLLTYEPAIDQVNFYKGLHDFGFDVFVVSDNTAFDPPDIAHVRFLRIDDHLCVDYGYTHLNPMITRPKKIKVSAWERALFHFSREDSAYAHVWFIEDDVFVPTLSAIPNIDSAHPDADIVSKGNIINTTGELRSWYWWQFIPKDILNLPWAWSLVCAVRLSRAVLREADRLIQNNKHILDPRDFTRREALFFIEYLFHTIALHNGMKIEIAPELRTLEWRRWWSVEEMRGENLYHPVKGWESQREFRKAFQG